MPKLTVKQQKFIDAYLAHGSATQAAIDAGYSAKTAHSAGPRLLENVGVRGAIDRAMEEAAERAVVKQEDVLRELKRGSRGQVQQSSAANTCTTAAKSTGLKASVR